MWLERRRKSIRKMRRIWMNGMRRREDEDMNEGDEGDCTWELYNYKAGAATVPQTSSETEELLFVNIRFA